MNPIARTWASFKAAAVSLGMRFTRGTSSWGSWLMGSTEFDYRKSAGNGRTNAAVMSCVRWAQRTIPEAPLQIMERNSDGERIPVPDHALQVLLERPNDYYSGLHLLSAVVADLMLGGNAYIIKIRSGARRVVNLWWIPASMIEPRWPDDGSAFISHYDYTVDGQVSRLNTADVIHIRQGFDPDNIRKGLSDLAALFREVATDNEAANWTASLLRNGAVPGVIISPAGDAAPTQGDMEKVKADFVQRFGGDQRGQPLVMMGPTKVDVLSFNPKDMNLRDLRMIPEERITAVLGVPAIVVGLGAGLQRSTFSNFSEAREAAYESFIIPMQRLLVAELHTQLVPEFGDPGRLRIQFDLKQVRVLQDDQNALHERARADLAGGLLTLNQALVMIGEAPVDGAAGDVRYVPNTVTVKTLDTLIPEEQPAAALTQPTPLRALPAPADDPAVDEAAAGKSVLPSALKAADLSDDALLARYEVGLTPLVETLAADLLDAFEALAETVAGRVSSHLGKASANGHAGVAVAVKAGEAIAGLVTAQDHAEIASLLRSYVLKSMRQAAEDLAPLTGDKPVRITRNMPAVKAAIADMESRLPGIVETTGADFGRLVRRLERRPGSVPIADVQQALRDYVSETYVGRGNDIARTELGHGHAAGVLLVAEKSGIAARVRIHDGTGDGPCAARNGMVVTLAEARGITLAHPNCRLAMTPFLDQAS